MAPPSGDRFHRDWAPDVGSRLSAGCCRPTAAQPRWLAASIFLRRMRPDAYPECPSGHDQGIVHVERSGGRPAHRRQADDLRAVSAPGKVVAPALLARIEERSFQPGFGISGVSSCLLVPVAASACQAEVVLGRDPLARAQNNVVRLATEAAQLLGGPAILAAASGSLADKVAQPLGDVSRQCRGTGLRGRGDPAEPEWPGPWPGARPNVGTRRSNPAVRQSRPKSAHAPRRRC